MKLNGREKLIYDVIVESIDLSFRPYSCLTNTEIAQQLGISAFTVRDKVNNLHKKGVVQRVCDFWDEDNQYHNRVLYKGKIKTS